MVLLESDRKLLIFLEVIKRIKAFDLIMLCIVLLEMIFISNLTEKETASDPNSQHLQKKKVNVRKDVKTD